MCKRTRNNAGASSNDPRGARLVPINNALNSPLACFPSVAATHSRLPLSRRVQARSIASRVRMSLQFVAFIALSSLPSVAATHPVVRQRPERRLEYPREPKVGNLEHAVLRALTHDLAREWHGMK